MCLSFNFTSSAQDCGCTISEVQSNQVMPCDKTIGEVITVGTVPELWAAINQANSTDGNLTILIEDGTYQIASTASFPYITASNVVFRSLSGNRDAVTIRGGGMVPTNSTEDGFLIAGDNVTIADLTISDVGNHGIQVSGHNLYVHNVRIRDTYEQMLKGSSSEPTIESAIIQCSLFEYTAGIGPNYYIGGLDIHKGHNWLVRDNVFKNIISPGGSIAEHAIHFWNTSANNIIERNLIINCDRGIGFGLGNNGIQNQGGVIKNNMIYNSGVGQFSDVGIGLESSPNTSVYHNTIYVAYPNAIEYRFESTTNVNIANNLTNRSITSRNGGTGLVESNITDAESSWFMDLTTGDLHLSSAIEAVIDQGINLAAFVSDDFDQNPRYANQAFDIGAQELATNHIDHHADDSSFFVYPNPCPSGHILNLSTDQDLNDLELIVLDASGKLISKQKQIQSENITIDSDHMDAGLYFISIKRNGQLLDLIKFTVLP